MAMPPLLFLYFSLLESRIFMKSKWLPFALLIVFYGFSAAQETDSIAYFKYAEKCSLMVTQGREDLSADLEAARSLAEIGFYKEACEQLIPAMDSAYVDEDYGTESVPVQEKQKSFEIEVGAGVDYYKYTDSDSSLYRLYQDTLYGKADTAVFADESPADIFAEAALVWRPEAFYVRKITPYLRFSNLYQKEKVMLYAGGPEKELQDQKLGFTFMQSYTRYLDRAEKDSSDFLEVQGILRLGWPFRALGMDFRPLAQASVASEQYAHDRPGYESMRETGVTGGLSMAGSGLFADARMEISGRNHAALYDSLDAVIYRPGFQVEYMAEQWSAGLTFSREVTRTPARNAADDRYTTAEFSLSYDLNSRVGFETQVSYESEATGFGDTFYMARDTLFSSWDSGYEVVYEKYSLNGRRFGVTPGVNVSWTDEFSTEVNYTFEQGRYPKLDKVDNKALDYAMAALEDSYRKHRAGAELRWSGGKIEGGLSGAWERLTPTIKDPVEPENHALSADAELDWIVLPALELSASGGLERRLYKAEKGREAREVLSQSMSLSIRKGF